MTTESKRLKEEAKKYGVPVQTYALATLMAAGWTAAEAYALAYYKNESFSASQNAQIRDNIVQNPTFGEMVENIRNTFPSLGLVKHTASSSPIPSKDELAQIIATEMRSLSGKERVDAAMRLADLYAMKKEEVKDDEEQIIHVYLPLTCPICPKYLLSEKVEKAKRETKKALEILTLHDMWQKYNAKIGTKPEKEAPSIMDVAEAVKTLSEMLSQI